MSEGFPKIITNKLLILILMIIIFIIYRIFLPDKDSLNEFSYYFDDKVLLSTLDQLTKFLAKNLQLRDFFLLTGFLNLDILLLIFLSYYVKFGSSCKPIICFLLFYGIRALFQKFFLLDYYPIYLFTYPGFRSLSVPTSRAADFFFSGHTGCAFLLTLFFRDWKESKLFYYGCIVTFLQMFVMTAVRAHYSIDVIFGLIIAHYVWIVVSDYCEIIDKYIPWFVNHVENADSDKFLQNKNKCEVNSLRENCRQMKIIYE